jgi:peptide/nickel transport system substrate-binding protein
MAVDRDALVDVLLQRATVPASQPAGRSVFGYDPEIPPYPYDPARARALLAAAGHPDGFSFTLETAGVGAAALAVVQQVAADLKKIGVSMEIRLVPTPQFLKNVLQTGETADAFTFPWPSTPTLDVLRSLRVHSCLQPHAWYCDADATEAMAAAEAAFDQAKGLAMRQELGRRYHDQAPAIFLYEQASFAGLSRRVRGFEDAFGFVSYDKLDIKN